MADPITFQASVAKVQTLADGGLRFTFDAGEGALMAMAELAACKQHGVYLEVVCTPSSTGQEQGHGKEQHELSKGTKRKSKWTTSEGAGAH